MTKGRILLVGDGNHQFITNYVKWLNSETKNDFIIDILSYTQLKENNKKYYNLNFRIKDNNLLFQIISKIKGIRRYYRFYLYKNLISRLPKYDYIHFHFISIDSYYIVEQFRKNPTLKIILSIWGSDMYRVKSLNEKEFLKTCQRANILTFTNQKSIDFFKNKYNWENNNLYLCRFGLAPLEKLKELSLSRQQCKKQLNWNNNKLAIMIGYNLNPAQQHLDILNQLENEIIKEFKDKIQLILPITYGGTIKYKNQILKKLKQLPFEYFIYDKYLKDAEIAYIRQASEIMIQLQLTDQFSGSMQEHLFARNVVITGSWLPYETLKEYGAWFIEIDKLDELSKVLSHVIKDFHKYESNTINNPQTIAELSSWVSNIQDWIKLYNK